LRKSPFVGILLHNGIPYALDVHGIPDNNEGGIWDALSEQKSRDGFITIPFVNHILSGR
jgi:hypothetical protein